MIIQLPHESMQRALLSRSCVKMYFKSTLHNSFIPSRFHLAKKFYVYRLCISFICVGKYVSQKTHRHRTIPKGDELFIHNSQLLLKFIFLFRSHFRQQRDIKGIPFKMKIKILKQLTYLRDFLYVLCCEMK